MFIKKNFMTQKKLKELEIMNQNTRYIYTYIYIYIYIYISVFNIAKFADSNKNADVSRTQGVIFFR